MELSVCLPIVFPDMPLDKALCTVGEIGYRFAECWRVTDEEADALIVAKGVSRVEILSIVTDDFCLNDPEHRDAWLGALEKTAVRAERLGARFMVTQVGRDNGAPREIQRASIVEGLRRAVEILQKHRVTLLIEPLNTLVNHPGYFMEKSADAFSIVEEVNSPFVQVVYDIYHQQISEGNIIPTVTGNLDKIPHLHGAAHPKRCEIFLGENDYRVILRAIENAGYRGVMTLEYIPTLDPVESLKKTIDYIKY